MPDQETGRPTPSEPKQAGGPPRDASEKQDQLFGDLSEAARGVVHSPADPRLEQHLARIGLSEGEATPSARTSAQAPASDTGGPEQLARLEAALEIANWRLRVILWTVVALAVAVVGLAVVVISR